MCSAVIEVVEKLPCVVGEPQYIYRTKFKYYANSFQHGSYDDLMCSAKFLGAEIDWKCEV